MPEADSGISERKLQAGSFAERSSVVGKRSAANRIVHDNKGSGVGTAGSILPTLPERNRVAVFCSPFFILATLQDRDTCSLLSRVLFC
jgi:hypothetical protein